MGTHAGPVTDRRHVATYVAGIVVLAVLVVAGLLLAGCGSSGHQAARTSQSYYSAPVACQTFDVWYSNETSGVLTDSDPKGLAAAVAEAPPGSSVRLDLSSLANDYSSTGGWTEAQQDVSDATMACQEQ